jgi:hypothetical protein
MRNIKKIMSPCFISKASNGNGKPKNYSRKGSICSCLCFILCKTNILEKNIKVVYEVEPNSNRIKYGSKQSTYKQQIYWGNLSKS